MSDDVSAPQPSAPESADDDLVTGVEAFLLGRRSGSQVNEWLDNVLQRTIGTGLTEVLFRSGRIDAVYAVTTTDTDRVLVKVHRPPLDVAARAGPDIVRRKDGGINEWTTWEERPATAPPRSPRHPRHVRRQAAGAPRRPGSAPPARG